MDVEDIFVSLVVLVCVSFAADHGSPLLAAFAATAPTGTALSLYLIANRRGGGHHQDTAAFLIGAAKGLAAAIAFCAAAYAAARRDIASPVPLIACGLVGWATAWGVLSAI